MKKNNYKTLLFCAAFVLFAQGALFAQEGETVVTDTVAVDTVAVVVEHVTVSPQVSAPTVDVAVTEKKAPDVQQSARVISNQMKEHLILADAQNMKVYIINLDFLKKTFENNKNPDKAERNKRQRALEDERDAKLKSVLNDKQFKVFIANRPIDRKRIIPFYE